MAACRIDRDQMLNLMPGHQLSGNLDWLIGTNRTELGLRCLAGSHLVASRPRDSRGDIERGDHHQRTAHLTVLGNRHDVDAPLGHHPSHETQRRIGVVP